MEVLSREIRFLLARLVTNFFAVLLAAQVLDDGIELPAQGSQPFWATTLALAAVLAVLNSYVRPVVELVLKPIGCLLSLLTFGLSHFVISALVFWGATLLVDDITINGVSAALVGTVIVAVVGAFGSFAFGGRAERE